MMTSNSTKKEKVRKGVKVKQAISLVRLFAEKYIQLLQERAVFNFRSSWTATGFTTNS